MFQPQPKDGIAAMVVMSYVILKIAEVDGALDPALFLVLGYYFVKRENGKDSGK